MMDTCSSLPGQVITAQEADAGTLSEVIAEAFCDLAASRWLIADPAARWAIFPGYFRIYVEYALARGIAHTTPDRTAVALWMPAGQDGPPPDPDYDARLAAATSPWTERFVAFDAALARHHPSGAAHHHLAFLAVRPGSQGHGTGTALLHAHHASLDAAGMPAYLEASSLRSRRLYLAHGYNDHGTPIHLAGGGGLMYPMWRDNDHQGG